MSVNREQDAHEKHAPPERRSIAHAVCVCPCVMGDSPKPYKKSIHGAVRNSNIRTELTPLYAESRASKLERRRFRYAHPGELEQQELCIDRPTGIAHSASGCPTHELVSRHHLLVGREPETSHCAAWSCAALPPR